MFQCRKLTILFLALFLIVPAGLLANGPENSIALRGATVYTAVGPPIENATILIENGKITAVGRNVTIPYGVKVIDVAGKQIIPGLIDEHSHIGGNYFGNDINEFTMPIGPENRAVDAMNFELDDWYEALKGGVTTVITGPGSGERMGGQSITVKTHGADLSKRILKESRELKMAVNARNLSHIPNIRATFLKAKEYMKKWEKYESGDKTGPPPKKDLRMEAVVPVLKGEEMVRCHIHYANDMITFLKLKSEFGFDLTFIHSSEAYKVKHEIAKRGVRVITLPLATRIAVADDMIFGVKELLDAGVKVALHTDHPVVHQKLLRINACMVIRYGVPELAALEMVTINPATSSKIDNRVGSIETGKDADLVVLDGTWYEPSTRVDMVFVDGVIAYDRKKDDSAIQEDK